MTNSRSAVECLREYLSRDDEQLSLRSDVSIFTGVNNATVRRWVNGSVKPNGESLIKLRVFMELQRYEVEVLSSMSTDLRALNYLVATNDVSTDQMTKLLGYPNRQQTFRLLLHPSRPTREREARFDEIRTEYEEVLRELGDPHFGPSQARDIEVPESSQPTQSVTSKLEGLKHVQIIGTFVHQMKAAMPLAELIASDEFTAEERREMHELAGFNFVFKFSNVMNQLCSETARRDYMRPE